MPENKPNTPAPAPGLSFERVEALPGAKQINSLTNPFQGEVNRLAKEGGASRLVCAKKGSNVPDGMYDDETARRLIRAAVQNIGRGVDTRSAPIPDGKGGTVNDRVYVYFAVREKRDVKRGEN